MSNDKKSFSLIQAPKFSSYCQGSWNEKMQEYEQNSVKTVKCCLDDCSKYVNFCFENCRNAKDKKSFDFCVNQCKSLETTCKNRCFEYPSQTLDEISKCMESLNCGVFANINSDCMRKNSEEIIECCKKKCTEGKCERECDDFSELIMTEKIPGDYVKKSSNFWRKWRLVIFLAVCLIAFLVYCISSQFKHVSDHSSGTKKFFSLSKAQIS